MTGQVDTLEPTDEGDIVVSFKSRSAAEQGLAKGTNIASVGSVQVSWFTGKPSTSSNGISAAPATQQEADDSSIPPIGPGSPEIGEDAQMQEENDSGGWGGDDFGMM